MDPAVITLCVLAVAAFLFVTELIPLAVTAMAACTALGILGVLPSKQVYAAFLTTAMPIASARPVLNMAAPMTNRPPKRTTVELDKPA